MSAAADSDAVVLLTRDGVEHRHVARVLAENLPGLRLIVEHSARGGRRAAFRRAWRAGPRRFADKAGATLYRALIRDAKARRRSLIRMLGEPNLAQPVYDAALAVNTVNDLDSVRALRRLRPKLVLVFGTGIVRSPVFRAIDCPILNLHTGLSPQYRGSACFLWPLIDDRLDLVGVTVHDCSPVIDGGGILATDAVSVIPGDTVHDVFARQVLVGGALYAQCAARELQSPAPRAPQDLSLGREYRLIERGLIAELAARRRLRRYAKENRP